jgi:hypothetical protein
LPTPRSIDGAGAAVVAGAFLPGARSRLDQVLAEMTDDEAVDPVAAEVELRRDTEFAAARLAELRRDLACLPLQSSRGTPCNDPLLRRVAMAITALGFAIHDCHGLYGGPAAKRQGGVCLLAVDDGGVIVGWTHHDSIYPAQSLDTDLWRLADCLQDEMNELLIAYLQQAGFTFEPFGSGGARYVVAGPTEGWDPDGAPIR